MKECRKCSDELVIGDNWYKSSAQTKNYICKPCHKGVSNEWFQENPKQNKKLHFKSYLKTYESHRLRSTEYNKRIPAGVYCIKEHGKIIYVGESGQPYNRVTDHFTKLNNPKQAVSSVSYDLSIGKLKRENLSYEMLCYEDNHKIRLQKEKDLINKINPPYNMRHK